MRNFNPQSKHEPVVHEVDLLDCNPQYAHIRFPSGRESTVSLRHLAPTAVPSDDRVVDDTSINTSRDHEETPMEDGVHNPSRPSSPTPLLELQGRTRPYNLRNREA